MLLTDPEVEAVDEERLTVLVLKGGMKGESLLGLLRTTPAGAAGDWSWRGESVDLALMRPGGKFFFD